MKNSVREHRTNKDFGPLFSGELLRDEAIAKVSEHNGKWLELCVSEVEGISFYRGEFTGEDLRHHCEQTVGLPHHSNAWGALISVLVKRRIIVPTGEYRAMRDQTSHARKTPVYSKA